MVDSQQYHGFYELGLYHRSSDGDDRLVRKYRSSFRNCPYVALELKFSEILQKIFAEKVFTSQIFDILIGKLEIPQIVDHLLYSGHDRISPAVGHSPEEHIKIGDIICHTCLKIAVGHGELVKVCRAWSDSFCFPFGFPPCDFKAAFLSAVFI